MFPEYLWASSTSWAFIYLVTLLISVKTPNRFSLGWRVNLGLVVLWSWVSLLASVIINSKWIHHGPPSLC